VSELFASPAAGFDHPFDILDGCHERIRRQCALIGRIARHLAARGPDAEAREAARNVMRYFDTAGANHHRDEEDDLFPELLGCVPPAELAATRALVGRLRAEHVELDAAWTAMRRVLAGLAQRGECTLGAAAAEAFAQAYERHIALEEAELLPLARRVCDARQVARLGERMARRRGVARPPA
jgi:hemerythrin-like domain-containing protein